MNTKPLNEMTPEEARAEVVRTFEQGIEDTRNVADQFKIRGAHVVCIKSDFTPFRTDGKEIRLFGGEVWTGSKSDAVMVCHSMQKQTETVLAVFPVQIWAQGRIAALSEMIKMIEQVKGNE